MKANSVLHYLTMPCGEKKLLADDRSFVVRKCTLYSILGHLILWAVPPVSIVSVH